MTERIQISLPGGIKEEIDRWQKKLDITRSKFFIIAIYRYLEELKKKDFRQKLKDGYQMMQKEITEAANESFECQIKTLNRL